MNTGIKMNGLVSSLNDQSRARQDRWKPLRSKREEILADRVGPELAAALGIPERTMARRKREGMLNSEESAKVVRLARVIERAQNVFEGLDASLHWLKSPNAALSGA